jgi:hypothetical protein
LASPCFQIRTSGFNGRTFRFLIRTLRLALRTLAAGQQPLLRIQPIELKDALADRQPESNSWLTRPSRAPASIRSYAPPASRKPWRGGFKYS